jgi:hypothetical protein
MLTVEARLRLVKVGEFGRDRMALPRTRKRAPHSRARITAAKGPSFRPWTPEVSRPVGGGFQSESGESGIDSAGSTPGNCTSV